MRRKKQSQSELKPYWSNPNICLYYELQWKSTVIKPGDMIKVKNDRNIYRFDRLVVDTSTGKSWVDVLNVTLGGFYSFYVERISGPVIAKRSRRKKSE